MNIEKKIIQHLIYDPLYVTKVLPHIERDYFVDLSDQLVVTMIKDFVNKYGKSPTADALMIEIDQTANLHQNVVIDAKATLSGIEKPDQYVEQWLVDATEKFCQDRALWNAIALSATIFEGKDPKQKLTKGSIPELLSNALAISFDTKIGHDYLAEYVHRREYYHLEEHKVPFDLDMLNKITRGGVSKKTLNVLLASTGVGKTMAMCHMAAGNLAAGKNVLYITMEMSELEIARRIDCNLLDVPMEYIEQMPDEQFDAAVSRIKQMTKGRLIIKEYAGGNADANNFRYLLNELKMKQGFVPDIIYIDYLNICRSFRMKMNGDSYQYVKTIAEELRALAVENDVPIISATQTNRGGYQNSDIDMADTSESFGLPMTVDLFLAMIVDDDLVAAGQILFKQLKSRYSDPNIDSRFMIGVDRSKMRLFNAETAAQKNLMPDKQANTAQRTSMQSKFSQGLFKDVND